jgi:hypothetical protein
MSEMGDDWNLEYKYGVDRARGIIVGLGLSLIAWGAVGLAVLIFV